MSYERTIHAPTPKPARNRVWQATALLEAPDVDGAPGEWEAIEAVPGETTLTNVEVAPGVVQQVSIPTGVVADTVTSRHARFDPGWYRLQWYDTGQNSKFSPPVRVSDQEGSAASPGRWN